MAIYDTVDHDGVEHAGYLSFLSLLSLFPFLVFFVAMVGSIGKSELGEQLIGILLDDNELIPSHLLSALEPRIHEIVSGPPQGLLTIAVLGAIWTASSAVEGLRTILNRAYRVNTPPAYIFRRLMSILQFLILTLLLIVAMMVLVLTPVIWQAVTSYLEIDSEVSLLPDWISNWNWTFVRYGFTATILFFVVCSIYYILPNIKQTWRVVFPGAILVVIGWISAGSLFASYLSSFNQFNVIYGSLGGVIVSLLFFYIFSMILILGAEFNYSLNYLKGKILQPKQTTNDDTETKN
ncbi:MAG: YihY/virulence factor BrkB family protein [Rickettsiales bacterium]|nr:YihY/virulence factor BrkB family protein [Rickettsiales bacterium]